MTTAYHPQANGLVERAHRQLKDALRARGASTDWPSHLPWVLLGLHAAPKEISGISSAEAVFGGQLVLPGHYGTNCAMKREVHIELRIAQPLLVGFL
jgi:hypothetical protein